jgi:hypothetical protein
LRVPVERKNLRHKLIRPDDYNAATLAIEAAHGENIITAL